MTTTSMLARAIALSGLWILSACPAPHPPSGGSAREQTDQTATRRGTLTYTPLPAAKTVEAYLGHDLVLVDGETSWDLSPGPGVSFEALVALAGQRVEVTARRIPAHAPDPMVQAPQVAPGVPMAVPETWQVLSVRPLSE